MVDVRRATGADLEVMAELRWEWRLGQGRELTLGYDEFVADHRAWAEAHADSHVPFLAEVGAAAVGIAWLCIVERIPGPDAFVRLSGNVQSVYVAPGHRGAGVGAALVQALIDEARARRVDYLTVHPSEPSFPLYRRLGFREWHGVLELDVGRTRMAPEH